MHNTALESKPTANHRWSRWAFIAICIWLALIGGIELIRPAGNTTSLCVFRNVTGLPCPTCGSTRAVLALTRGDIAQAAMFNPLLMMAILAGLIWLLMPRAFKNSVRARITARPAIVWLPLVITLGVNWMYLLWREG